MKEPWIQFDFQTEKPIGGKREKIVEQAVDGDTMWSRWEDGTVTRSERIWVNGVALLGADEEAVPPAGLRWVETARILDAIRST